MKNAKSQFFPNSAGMWLFSCHPPVALLAALHLQEGRVPEGQVQGVWLLWFVTRRCWQCLCLTSQQRCWGGCKCHVFLTQIHSRLEAEARASQSV